MIGEGRDSSNQKHHTHVRDGVKVGFFTDPTVCIGCKACEVACKEWNDVPADPLPLTGRSYDNTVALGASSWRHVLFLEEPLRSGTQITGPMGEGGEDPFRWQFLSDVCKHCEEAGCLEACPTGSIVRTETGTVYVQDDVCNGCGYCVVTCPFGVIDRRDATGVPGEGGAFKCTFCYDRQISGLVPACAKACPTESIRFGPLDDLAREAEHRLDELRRAGFGDARLYDPQETSVRGTHATFLLLGPPETYNLPPRPDVPTIHLRAAYGSMIATAVAAAAFVVGAFLWL